MLNIGTLSQRDYINAMTHAVLKLKYFAADKYLIYWSLRWFRIMNYSNELQCKTATISAYYLIVW